MVSMSEKIMFKTQDGVNLVGDYYSSKSGRGVILLHMMPADRQSWTAFAKKLQAADFQALAIDLRGHGESQGGPDGYRRFSDAEHQASRLDVESAADFLRGKGVEELHIIGASIGANLALEYAVNHSHTKSAALLSPGLNYRGIETLPLAEKLAAETAVYIVASRDDEESYQAAEALSRRIALGDRSRVKIFEASDHGTAIFERNPEFGNELVEWLKQF